MRLVIIGPATPIPPIGWGAVESLIWDYTHYLEQEFGMKVLIIHQNGEEEIIHKVNQFEPDIIHIHYDNFWHLWDKFQCKKVIVTNHYAYIESPQRRNHEITQGIAFSGAMIHCLSPGVQKVYTREYQVPIERTFVLPNGADTNKFRYTDTPVYTKYSIYLAKIDYRKRQSIYQDLLDLHFVGNYEDPMFNPIRPNYLGEWRKEQLYQSLTEYPNLVLLSDGEVHPLVCCEALICGLGLVVSEAAAANLDRTKPFIEVIPNEKLFDLGYVHQAIQKNRNISLQYRQQIREYGLQEFSWRNILTKYIDYLRVLL
jgi:glycosyltransferase involved in cell wall biosynthesis